MALNWSLVFIFGFGLFTTFSSIRSVYRLTTGRDDSNFTEIVTQYGYISEEHTVQTEDGYLLTLFRITQSPRCKKEKMKTPVLLLNGLLASADCFLDAGLGNGLPYLISDACYDLWLGNARGTNYGRAHTTLDPDTDKAFWDFSVDEIGKYDVPATIDYVINHTGEPQLNYIGVSQGTGSFLVMCSERPEYSDKVKVLIGLAPASRHTNSKSPIFRAVAKLMMDYQSTYEALGIWEIMWKGMLDPIRLVCQSKPGICYSIVALLDSPHPGSITEEGLRLSMLHFPSGTSVKNLARYGQSTTGDRYCKFDYGPEKNMELYGGEPPDFNLSNVKMPTYFLTGKNDGIVDYEDMVWLVNQLPNVKEFSAMERPLWNHLDMVISKYIGAELFPKVLNYLQIYNGNEESIEVVSYSNDTISSAVTLLPKVGLVGQMARDQKVIKR